MHRDWTSAENRQRADEAEARFERVWNNENPSLWVLSLPEAVRQRLVQLAERVKRPTEIDHSSEAPLDVPSPATLERLRFALLRDGPKLRRLLEYLSRRRLAGGRLQQTVIFTRLIP